jgi:lipoprotein-anchoring transpeptidase ErfK/SrfK
MSQNKSTNIQEHLRLGIDAARTGNDKAARAHLVKVLRQDPNHIPALLWLAFVLPSPKDTIQVLKRVLALDPDNDRARAGIRWARGRLGLDPDEPEADGPSPRRRETDPPADSAEDSSIRQQLLSTNEIQKKAKKGVLAHRARRTIRPLLLMILVTGVLGFASIGLGALALVPPDTLAAWLPASMPNDPATLLAGLQPADSAPAQSAEAVPLAPDQTFATGSDRLAVAAPDPEETNQTGSTAVSLPADAPADSEANVSVPLPNPALPAVQLSSFVGPGMGLAEIDAATPADTPVLAHQPDYPGQKWIEVNLTKQQVTAWEGNVPVLTFMASTGLPNTPTVTGKYHIYWKLEKTLMIGDGYYLPDVPYTMYFYGGYALHGTYWHNNFGQPMSHGCVNLETGNAQTLFEWADPVLPPGQTQVTASTANPGTLVVVHQ